MSDQPSPPKPKPGSLRDRIAAFEKPSTSTNAPPPLAPRPKAGQVSWKPRQATPPESPAAEETSIPQPKKSSGGMSATDAKESIGKGVSLKERMAALQGKGAFGAPPPIAPKPATEKPKWKPPPTVALPPDDGNNEEKEVFVEKSEQVLSTSALGEQGSRHSEEKTEPTTEEGDAEDDPQEEERKRRAALAARMARLGGARVGMGAPVFGGSAYKKPQPKSELETFKEAGPEPAKAEVSELGPSTSTPETEAEDQGTKKEIERKASDSSSLLPPDTSSSPSISPRTPNSMPVPAAPRRAAPPRRKAPKSPAPPPVEEPETINDTIGDKEPEGGEVSISADPVPVNEEVPTKVLDDMVDDIPPEPSISVESLPVEETPIQSIKTDVLEPEISEEAPFVVAQQQTDEPEIAHDETEEDEAVRRKRVAERLAKSGGVNPFAPSSQRKQTLPIESPEESPAPPTPERTSFRKSSADSVSNSFSPPPARRPSTKPSMDSVMSRDIISHDDDIISPARPAIAEEPERNLSLEEADITEQKVHEEPDDEYVDQEAEALEEGSRFEEAPRELAAPPLPAASTRPVPADVQPTYAPPPTSHAVVPEYEPEDDESEPAPPPPPRRSMPPPPQLAEDEEEADTFHPQPVEPPRRLPPRPVLDDEGEMSDAPLPHLSRRSIPTPPPEEAIEDDQMSDYEPKPISVSHPTRVVPPTPVESMSQEAEEIDEEEGELKESTEEILPTPPRRAPSLEQQDEPLFIPPPPPKSANTVASIAQRRASQQVENVKLPPPPTLDPTDQVSVSTPTLSVSDRSGDEQKGSEILDEEDGDPIDPSFYSPPSRRASALAVTPEPEPEQEQESAEDEEQARRRTIAERMAKLGGIRFGAAPIPTPRPPPPRHQESEEGNQGEGDVEVSADDQPELTEEEEERARKERIAAKMATMGGMRIGMQPFGVGMLPGKAPAPPARQSSSSSVPQQPPRYTAPPPPPPPQDVDSEYESLSTSDEGVRVEAEESEMEEVNYEDAQEEQEEEVAPPPVPAREGRRPSGQYMPSSGRPPVPTTVPSRKSSAQTETSPVPTPRKSSSSQPLPPSSSEYVMVEGSDDDFAPPPPPPPRASRPPPPRAAPVPPAPALPPSESISSQWEMPSIPSIDFGGNAELSLSWTDDMASSISSVQPPSEPPAQTKPTATSNQPLNSDDLIAVWGKVGVHICEVATNLHEKSKKTLIGDGTYRGFIDATLREVPNAASISDQDYGYLIYMQSGASVQKRASEILPGDIVWMHEAKFKGHKGLQNYSQNVEELVGVVFEFEAKKFKIRVFQANQHVGQQTVESVSYRLEDLKNGMVKIFRVLEA